MDCRRRLRCHRKQAPTHAEPTATGEEMIALDVNGKTRQLDVPADMRQAHARAGTPPQRLRSRPSAGEAGRSRNSRARGMPEVEALRLDCSTRPRVRAWESGCSSVAP